MADSGHLLSSGLSNWSISLYFIILKKTGVRTVHKNEHFLSVSTAQLLMEAAVWTPWADHTFHALLFPHAIQLLHIYKWTQHSTARRVNRSYVNNKTVSVKHTPGVRLKRTLNSDCLTLPPDWHQGGSWGSDGGHTDRRPGHKDLCVFQSVCTRRYVRSR